jgi:hypothetical protein
MKAVAKGDSSFLHGMKIAEDVKMPTVMKHPIVGKHPKTENLRLLSVELPRELVNFTRPHRDGGGVMDKFEAINKSKTASLFHNPDRRSYSAEGLMSAELFKDLAKQGKVKIHREPPIKREEPKMPFSQAESMLPHRFKESISSGMRDRDTIGKSNILLNSLSNIDFSANIGLSPINKVVQQAWKPHSDFRQYLGEVVKQSSGNMRADSFIAESIRNTAEKMLPISEPRKRGINRNLTYRRIFKEPKDE